MIYMARGWAYEISVETGKFVESAIFMEPKTFSEILKPLMERETHLLQVG
jgi:hypothetical protein